MTTSQLDDPTDVELLGRCAFAANYDQACAYAALLRGRGTEWGLIGPREGARVWGRHLLNSVAIESEVGRGSSVADVGSGAGLPGLPLAIARPDLQVTLVESLQRRARFLRLAVDELGLTDRVDVEHARAESVTRSFDVVVSRAVAPLQTLVPWCLGITRTAGSVLAMRGAQAQEELAGYLAATPAMRRRAQLVQASALGTLEPVRLVRVEA